jgi:PBP1b-binding outer membrane lipoprotein LpoB
MYVCALAPAIFLLGCSGETDMSSASSPETAAEAPPQSADDVLAAVTDAMGAGGVDSVT